ncbi:MAG: cytochrome P450 [Parvibaculaceae bacterium]
MQGIPRDPAFDNTLRLLAEGYEFIQRRCSELGTDIFETRLLLYRVVCVRGADAAEMFYAPDRFTRTGAMPQFTLRLLQDKGSVQLLEDAEHRHRKAMFLSLLMAEDEVDALRKAFRRDWLDTAVQWERRGGISLFDEMTGMLTRAALDWAGIPQDRAGALALSKALVGMIENAGSFGPGAWWALLKRRRTERLMRRLVRRIRAGRLDLPAVAPAHVVARHRDPAGRLLSEAAAAVEMLNVLRPIVAVARYIVYCAMALDRHPALRKEIEHADAAFLERFAEEVRRLYPFFPFIGGKSRKTFDWKGCRIEEGTWMLLDLYGTNRDGRRFARLERLLPDRAPSWKTFGFDFVPQGGGDPALTHRCPGEAMTVALMVEATRLLVSSITYSVPPQDLSLGLGHIPARLKSGFVMRDINVRCAPGSP